MTMFCRVCSAATRKDADDNLYCSEEPGHDITDDAGEFCGSHGFPVKGCPGCAAERAEDMD